MTETKKINSGKTKKKEEKVIVNSALKAKGIKHGVRYVERSHFVDEDGELHEDQIHWREDRKYFENSFLNGIAKCLIFCRCIPPDPSDLRTIKTSLLLMQWLALLSDLIAALVALLTFKDITYCCGAPIFDVAGNIPWKPTIRVLTIVYLIFVFLEIYPVVRKGFPFNLINPIIGFLITIAMFFYDTLTQALSMWAVESIAIACEFTLFRLKVRQIYLREKEIQKIGRLTKNQRDTEEGEDPDQPIRELHEIRQRYYQLKQEQLNDHTLVWYLRAGCYINIVLSLITLTLIIVVAKNGGFCFNTTEFPNPFDPHQLARCPLCANETDGSCEVCENGMKQCFYSYT